MQELLVLPSLPRLFLHGGEQLLLLAVRVVGLAVGLQSGGVAGKHIERAEEEGLVVQQQVLVLGVDVYETTTQLFEFGGWHGRVVDEGSALSRLHHLAPNDALVGVQVDVVVGKERGKRLPVQPKRGLNDTLALARLYALGLGSSAQQ